MFQYNPEGQRKGMRERNSQGMVILKINVMKGISGEHTTENDP